VPHVNIPAVLSPGAPGRMQYRPSQPTRFAAMPCSARWQGTACSLASYKPLDSRPRPAVRR
jgi:hypothetical protein